MASLKTIPDHPRFVPITLDHRDELRALLARDPTRLSDYSFTNLLAWSAALELQVSRHGDGVLIFRGGSQDPAMWQPLGIADPAVALAAAADSLTERGLSLRFERVGDRFREACRGLPTLDRVARWREDRDAADYLYRVADLVELKGNELQKKKNLLRQFQRRHPGARFIPLDAELARRCIQFEDAWCAERRCEEDPGLSLERCAVYTILSNFAALSPRGELLGGGLEVDGRIVAMTVAEALTPDTVVIHVEKGANGIPGVYQAINWEFLRSLGDRFRFVNREEDLGIPGLRQAKLSYQPCELLRKWRLEPVGAPGGPGVVFGQEA